MMHACVLGSPGEFQADFTASFSNSVTSSGHAHILQQTGTQVPLDSEYFSTPHWLIPLAGHGLATAGASALLATKAYSSAPGSDVGG
jgi:hypothetical protein